MLDGAAGGEGAGDREEDDFLVGPFWGLWSAPVGGKVGRDEEGGEEGGREGKRGDGEGIGGKGRGETFGCIVVNGDSARGDLGALLVWDVAEDHIAGQAVSDLEGCHLCFL